MLDSLTPHSHFSFTLAQSQLQPNSFSMTTVDTTMQVDESMKGPIESLLTEVETEANTAELKDKVMEDVVMVVDAPSPPPSPSSSPSPPSPPTEEMTKDEEETPFDTDTEIQSTYKSMESLRAVSQCTLQKRNDSFPNQS